MNRLTWFVFLSIIAISCLNEPDCYQLDNDEIIIAFNVMEFGVDVDTLKDIRISGSDTIFYENTITSTTLLPLNPNRKELTYIFRWNNGSIDTLLLGYSSQIQFVSDDCAQRYVFSNLKPLRSSFDSVRVFNGSPSYTPSTNLVIYRCANPDLGGVKFKKKVGTAESDSVLSVKGVSPNFEAPASVKQKGPSFYLPLNKSADTTMYEFTMASGAKENLALSYTRITRKSPIQDCEEVTFFSRIKIISTSFDTTATRFTNTAGSNTTVKSTSSQDPAIINFEIFL